MLDKPANMPYFNGLQTANARSLTGERATPPYANRRFFIIRE